ncbi:MAG: DUF389 domain-containing protein [Anaerolineales bacterium]|nr:DUF389 domain-containing protein [Anaerolineales bacterium]
MKRPECIEVGPSAQEISGSKAPHKLGYNKHTMGEKPFTRPSSWRTAIRHLWRRIAPPVSQERRGEVQVRLRDSSEPDFSYFLLVLLSSVIATLGLLMNSPATIIGAMLVAPLMSPIIGLGLGSIRGDDRLLKEAAAALFRGAGLAVLIAFLLTLNNRLLPFVPLIPDDLPSEVMARTQPSPMDLGVALAGGLAAAFALAMPNISAALPGVAIATALLPPLATVGIGLAYQRWDVAGGGFLLFITNGVAISASAMIVFFVLGFTPRSVDKVGRLFGLPRSLVVLSLVTILLLGPLTYISVQFVRDANTSRDLVERDTQIKSITAGEVSGFHEAEVTEWDITDEDNRLVMEITIRTPILLGYADMLHLRDAVGARLREADVLSEGQEFQLLLNQFQAQRLDPKIPPTATVTPTVTYTATPGPSPTPTATATLEPTLTSTPTATALPTYTATSLPTATWTPTTYPGFTAGILFPGLKLRQSPGGPAIATLREGEPLTVLYGQEIADGLVWVEVQDSSGRIGWIPQIYVLTPMPTATP